MRSRQIQCSCLRNINSNREETWFQSTKFQTIADTFYKWVITTQAAAKPDNIEKSNEKGVTKECQPFAKNNFSGHLQTNQVFPYPQHEEQTETLR